MPGPVFMWLVAAALVVLHSWTDPHPPGDDWHSVLRRIAAAVAAAHGVAGAPEPSHSVAPRGLASRGPRANPYRAATRSPAVAYRGAPAGLSPLLHK